MTAFELKLGKYFPPGATNYCYSLWAEHQFKLSIKKSRKSKFGDYRYQPGTHTHAITINNDLNPYAFLITYLHEVAHLVTFEKYGRKVKPHGQEWKTHFRQLCLPVLNNSIFPEELLRRLASYLKNPKASSCSDPDLMRALALYNHKPATFLSDLAQGEVFTLGNRKFKKESLQRTRYVCLELRSGRRYLISRSATVEV